jgi:PqqD family protein of HPr-rel-A system
MSEHAQGSLIFHRGNGQFFVLNRVGTALWRELAAGASIAEIRLKLQREYQIPPTDAQEDVREFLEQLLRRRLIQPLKIAAPPRSMALASLSAFMELLRYDVEMALFGFGRIRASLEKAPTRACTEPGQAEQRVLAAVSWACDLYWKPARCLQRSVVLARRLRRCGIPARLVIGYRAVPFFSHAWVEVNGRVVNDLPSYSLCLSILDRV